jgi:hypothetical protein
MEGDSKTEGFARLTYRRGVVRLHVLVDGAELVLDMKPEAALGLSQGLNQASSAAWTGALTVPQVPVTEEKDDDG